MPVTFQKQEINSPHQPSTSARLSPKTLGHTRPRQPDISLEQTGRLRVANMLAILNISHSTFYSGIRSGRYPVPDGRDGSFPYWMTSTIKKYLES